MSPDLEQLFRDYPSAPPSAVDLDAVVRRGRRVRVRQQVRGAAAVGVTGAVVLGVGAVAVSGSGRLGGVPLFGAGTADVGAGCQITTAADAAGASPLVTGDPKGASVNPGSVAGSPPPAVAGSDVPTSGGPTASGGSGVADATSEAVAGSGATTPPVGKPGGPAPAALTAVSLPDPAPGFGGRRAPDSVGLDAGSDGLTHWTAVFLVGVPCAHEASVLVGDFPMPATAGTPVLGSSPGPITDRPTVAGHPAYVTHDGDQTILYFATSRFTVEVVGSRSTTVAELVTLAESLENVG